MKSFLKNREHPVITVMLASQTEETLLEEIRASIEEGAEAIGLPIERLPAEMRTEKTLTKLISAAKDLPVYATCYLRGDVIEETDDERAEALLLALRCGAVLADIRADMFDPQEGEYSTDPIACQKQINLIHRMHEMGKEVLMSSHLFYDGELHFVDQARVFEIAKGQKARGADLVKIVSGANTEAELAENFKILTLLSEDVKMPFVFLCGGKKCLRHRLACGLIGEAIVFVKEKKYADITSPQQPIETIVGLFRLAGYQL